MSRTMAGETREAFLGRLREALVQAINGNPVTVSDAWDILREWDRATGTKGDIPNVTRREHEAQWGDEGVGGSRDV